MSHLLGTVIYHRQQQTRFLCAAHIKCFIRLDTMLFLTQNVLLKCTCTCYFLVLVLSRFKLLSGDCHYLSKNISDTLFQNFCSMTKIFHHLLVQLTIFGLLIRYFCFLILQLLSSKKSLASTFFKSPPLISMSIPEASIWRVKSLLRQFYILIYSSLILINISDPTVGGSTK